MVEICAFAAVHTRVSPTTMMLGRVHLDLRLIAIAHTHRRTKPVGSRPGTQNGTTDAETATRSPELTQVVPEKNLGKVCAVSRGLVGTAYHRHGGLRNKEMEACEGIVNHADTSPERASMRAVFAGCSWQLF